LKIIDFGVAKLKPDTFSDLDTSTFETTHAKGSGKRDWIEQDPDYDSLRDGSALPGADREASLSAASILP
jgi:hypothetical protein